LIAVRCGSLRFAPVCTLSKSIRALLSLLFVLLLLL